jgi:hypothetical protein
MNHNKFEFVRVYFINGDWKISMVHNGRPIEGSFTGYEAAGTAASIASAFAKMVDSDPKELGVPSWHRAA